MEKRSRAATTRDSEKYIVRFPDGMRNRVTEAAKANNRSINAEIIARLERSFADEPLRAGALDLNGLLSAAILLACDETKDDPTSRQLIAKAKESAQRLAKIISSEVQDAAAVDGKK